MNPYFDGENVHADSEQEAYAFMQGMEKGKELEQSKKKKDNLNRVLNYLI